MTPLLYLELFYKAHFTLVDSISIIYSIFSVLTVLNQKY